MSKVNFSKKIEELQKIQVLLRNARNLVEKELASKVLDAFLEGRKAEEIYELVRHIIQDVYGYDKIVLMRKKQSKPKQSTSLKSKKDKI